MNEIPQTFPVEPGLRIRRSPRRSSPLASAEAWHYIYVVTLRVNAVATSWEWDVKGTKGEEKKSIDGGPDTGPCLQTPRSDRYSLPGQWTILSRYLFTKPSHRKTIESNHEESDRRVSKRFFLGFWGDGFFNRHWTIFWKILQFDLYWWFYLLSMY